MTTDVVDFSEFYQTPLGQSVQRRLGACLRAFWPDLRGKVVATFGFTTPYLLPWLEKTALLSVLMPRAQGGLYWPETGEGEKALPNKTVLVDFNQLPLEDESIDLAFAIHALEECDDSFSFLRETWRVLKPEGKILIVVPNRSGRWAHHDGTPFGAGQPYSPSQIRRLLRFQGFFTLRLSCVLYGPMCHDKRLLGWCERFERIARLLFPRLGGVLVIEAQKQLYAPLLVHERKTQRRLIMPIDFQSPACPARFSAKEDSYSGSK